jgi:hypothetical protein
VCDAFSFVGLISSIESQLVSWPLNFDFWSSAYVWIVAGTHPSVVLELPDRKARGFLVPIAFKRLLLEHAYKVFGEMYVRT